MAPLMSDAVLLPTESPGEGKVWAVSVTLSPSILAAADALCPPGPVDTSGSEAPDTTSRVERQASLSEARTLAGAAGWLLSDRPAVEEGPGCDH